MIRRVGPACGDWAVHEHLVSADLFGRFGGDEFLIACADQTPASAVALAETIRAAVEDAAADCTPPLPGLTLSMGVAQADTDSGYSADSLFARADAALYEARRSGRDRLVVADARMRTERGDGQAARHLQDAKSPTHASCPASLRQRQHRYRQAAVGVAGRACQHVGWQVADIAHGDDLVATVGLDPDPGDAGVPDRHFQPGGGGDA